VALAAHETSSFLLLLSALAAGLLFFLLMSAEVIDVSMDVQRPSTGDA
jgi:hypothetical protein